MSCIEVTQSKLVYGELYLLEFVTIMAGNRRLGFSQWLLPSSYLVDNDADQSRNSDRLGRMPFAEIMIARLASVRL